MALAQRFFCDFWKIFKNTSFTEHIWMTFYFATVAGFILCNYIERRLSSSEKSLVRKKIMHISQVFYRFRIFFSFFVFSFSLTNDACLPSQLRKAYAVLWAANRFVGLETPKHNNFGQFRTFSKKHNFLVLTDPVVIRIYLRTAGEGRQMLKTC